MFSLKTSRGSHARYRLEYHLILVTKYRKPCITEELYQFLRAETERLFSLWRIEHLEMNHDRGHVHILPSASPQICLSSTINSYKSVTSRLIRKHFSEHLAAYYWKPYFWSRSYLILSSGGAPIEVIRRYIQNQGKE